LIAVGLALGKNSDRISELLEMYDQPKLTDSPDDIGLFITAAKNKGLEPSFVTNFGINSTATILSLEYNSENARLVTTYPHVGCSDTDILTNYMFQEYCTPLETKVYDALQKERHKNFLHKSKKFTIEHLICRESFDFRISDIYQNTKHNGEVNEKITKELLGVFLKEVISCLRTTKYEMRFTKIQSQYDFCVTEDIRIKVDKRSYSQERNMLIFSGKRWLIEDYLSSDKSERPLLNRILTDNKNIIGFFLHEFDVLNDKKRHITHSNAETITEIYKIAEKHHINL